MILSPSPIQPMTLPRPSTSTLSKPSFSISALMQATTSPSSQDSEGWEIIARRKAVMSGPYAAAALLISSKFSSLAILFTSFLTPSLPVFCREEPVLLALPYSAGYAPSHTTLR